MLPYHQILLTDGTMSARSIIQFQSRRSGRSHAVFFSRSDFARSYLGAPRVVKKFECIFGNEILWLKILFKKTPYLRWCPLECDHISYCYVYKLRSYETLNRWSSGLTKYFRERGPGSIPGAGTFKEIIHFFQNESTAWLEPAITLLQVQRSANCAGGRGGGWV